MRMIDTVKFTLLFPTKSYTIEMTELLRNHCHLLRELKFQALLPHNSNGNKEPVLAASLQTGFEWRTVAIMQYTFITLLYHC